VDASDTFGSSMAHTMGTKKLMHEPEAPESRPIVRLNKVVLVDYGEINNYVTETLLRFMSIAKELIPEEKASMVIDYLKNIERLDDVPELVFLETEGRLAEIKDFLKEFSSLSDFVRSKCKLVIIAGRNSSEEEKLELMQHPGIIRYFKKPLDVYQFKDFI
jgi:hypothetical protein